MYIYVNELVIILSLEKLILKRTQLKHVFFVFFCHLFFFTKVSILIIVQKDEMDPFDTTITGPWIGRWEVVNHNKHTDAFKPG